MIHRRGFITGLISLVAAPAIVRAGSLMPVKMMIEPIWPPYGRSPAIEFFGAFEELQAKRERFLIEYGAFGAAIIEIPGRPNYFRKLP